jgi:hypothetical protein
MVLRQNCWEHKKCGRNQGGDKVAEMGVCPAATQTSANGCNNGTNAGRICWAIAGTFCSGKARGTYACNLISCVTCDFYKKVKKEEADFRYSL